MITRVQVKNFRNLADVDVRLDLLTILVGRNGTGKSTFLDALRFVRDALQIGLMTAISQRGGIAAIRRWSPHGRPYDIEINIETVSQDAFRSYSFVIGTGSQGKPRVKRELCQIVYYDYLEYSKEFPGFEIKGGKWISMPGMFRSGQSEPSPVPVDQEALALPALANVSGDFNLLRSQIVSTSFYAIFPNTLRLPQRQTGEALLSEDGQNLATTLQNIKKKGKYYSDLVSALERVVEGVNDLRVVEAGGYLVTELKHEVQGGRSAWFPLAQESDGTLRILSVLAALYQEAPRSTLQSSPHTLIGLEEPELSVHPGALAVLSDVIEEAATRTQVIITTQSPDLISRFRADQLRVVERVDGQPHIGMIDEVQRETINDQLFSAGDLLRIEGLHTSSPEEPAAAHA